MDGSPLSTFDVVRGASLLRTRGRASEQIGLIRSPLPKYGDPGNLVSFSQLPHTRLTYHRTWETGLETEIRVADFSPAFFCLASRLTLITLISPVSHPASNRIIDNRFHTPK